MKSFLVDALRQADGTDNAAAAEERRIASTEAPELLPGDAEFDDTDEFRQLEIQEEYAPDIGSVSDSTISADAVGPVANAQPSDNAAVAATTLPKVKGADARIHTSALAKIGRLTPLLCVVTMLATAGVYTLISRLAQSNLNDDLDELSARSRQETTVGMGLDGWQDVPVADMNVINRIVAPGAGSVAPDLSGSSPAAKASPRPLAGSSTAAEITSRPDSGGIRIGVKNNGEPTVDDLAFPSVVTAFDAYGKQQYGLAETLYLRALKIAPHHPDGLAGLAAVYQQTGREKQAADTYQQLLGLDPDNTLAASAIISLRSRDADWDTESELKLLLQRFPGAHHIHYALGSYFAKYGRWADARHEFLAAYEIAPANADYSFNLAVSMEKLGESSAARYYYEKALATAEENSNVDTDALTRHLSMLTAQLRDRP